MNAVLRPAQPNDFDFCAGLYLAELEWVITAMHLDRSRQLPTLQKNWTVSEVRIITAQGQDVGWMQSGPRDDAVYLSHIYLLPAFQGRGIGRAVLGVCAVWMLIGVLVMRRMIDLRI